MIPAGSRYLVVVADDFGRSSSTNRAVVEAHEQGIVTAASIMTRGKGFEEAVLIARKRSALSVGLQHYPVRRQVGAAGCRDPRSCR